MFLVVRFNFFWEHGNKILIIMFAGGMGRKRPLHPYNDNVLGNKVMIMLMWSCNQCGERGDGLC